MTNAGFSLPNFESMNPAKRWLSFSDLKVGDSIKIKRKKGIGGLDPLTFDHQGKIVEITESYLRLDNGKKYPFSNIEKAIVYVQETKVVKGL